jgi:hypothetical protein
MFVSISMTTYDRTELTDYCIRTLNERTPRDKYEFIVIDNTKKEMEEWEKNTSMLQEYEKQGYIDKLVLNHFNNLGKSINDAWKMASPKADWLLALTNDVFCMENWFQNFESIVNSELKPDYIFCCAAITNYHLKERRKTKNGGSYLFTKNWTGNKKIPYGWSLAVKQQVVKEYKLKFREGETPFHVKIESGKSQGGSIYSVLYDEMYNLKLKLAELDKPCFLFQDIEIANPKYDDYYNERFNISKKYKLKLNRYKRRGGYINNINQIEEYYKESGYEIKDHYADKIKP